MTKVKITSRIKTFSKLLLTAGLVAAFLLVSPIRAEAKTGWVEKNKKWYYYGHKYDIIRGWFEVDGKWYHFDSTGAMETGWINIDGYWYYLKPNGAMATGWIRLGSAWYYLDENGVMVNNAYQNGCWLGKNGKWDTRYKQGKWKKNSTGWRYQDGNWYPRNKWLWIDGYCYYFDNRGYLVTDPDALTWAEIRNTVGTDGAYVRINTDNWIVDGAFVVVRGYSYIGYLSTRG